MRHITCRGSPYEIGWAHGQQGTKEIAGSLAFYAGLFQRDARLAWEAVLGMATRDFEPVLASRWPRFLEEMHGVADGAGVTLANVIALNVRTEIAFGLFSSDGCTMMAWHGQGGSAFIAQNWDWSPEQALNLVALTIYADGRPTIKMVTEAGIIGKIGLNSSGVGVTLNAIRAPALDANRLPCHLALRLALESPSRAAALASLMDEGGVASSCAIGVADRTGCTVVECGARDMKLISSDVSDKGRLYHTNHYLAEHAVPDDPAYLPDSRARLDRIRQLCEKLATKLSFERNGQGPTVEELRCLFADEQGLPVSINRNDAMSITLFNIVCDLERSIGHVAIGRLGEDGEVFSFKFSSGENYLAL